MKVVGWINRADRAEAIAVQQVSLFCEWTVRRSGVSNFEYQAPKSGCRMPDTQYKYRRREHRMLRLVNKRVNGFSLAEAMIATVVLAIASAGVLLPFTSGAAVRAEGMRRTLSAKLASDLMEEIINTPFDQILAGYDGYAEPQGQVEDASGAVFTGSNYANFSRNVSCAYVASQPFFIIVTVRVKYNGNEIISLSRLISE